MKSLLFCTATLTLFAGFVLLSGLASFGQENKPLKAVPAPALEVVQFHLEHRCYSCNKMEEYSRETVKDYPGVIFKLYNVEDKKNEKLAAQFKATGTSLFLFNPQTGRKKDLTAGAFLSVGNKEKFIKELKKHIEDFQKAL
jgi:hypothetical protein